MFSHAVRVAACLLLLCLLSTQLSAADNHSRRLLVLPVTAASPSENRAGAAERERVSEALTAALRDDLPDARLAVDLAEEATLAGKPVIVMTADVAAGVARDAKASYVLVGRYLVRGQTVRVDARLIANCGLACTATVAVEGVVSELPALRQKLVDEVRWQLDVLDATPAGQAAPLPLEVIEDDGRTTAPDLTSPPAIEGRTWHPASSANYYDPTRFARLFQTDADGNSPRDGTGDAAGTAANSKTGSAAGAAGGNAMAGGPGNAAGASGGNAMGAGPGNAAGASGGNAATSGSGNAMTHTDGHQIHSPYGNQIISPYGFQMGPVDPHVMTWHPGNTMKGGPGNTMNSGPGHTSHGPGNSVSNGPGNTVRSGTGNTVRSGLSRPRQSESRKR